MIREECNNCFDEFYTEKEREERKMKKFTNIEDAKKTQEEKTMVKTNNETINMVLQKGDIYYGCSSDGVSYFIPKNCIDALNEEVLVYIVKGGETTCETYNPNIDEGLGHMLECPDDFYQKLSDDVLSSPICDDASYDKNERWLGIRRPRVATDPVVRDSIDYMNQVDAYPVVIKPTGYYLHYVQKSPYLDKPFEAVEYVGDDNRYYYLSNEMATGEEEFPWMEEK